MSRVQKAPAALRPVPHQPGHNVGVHRPPAQGQTRWVTCSSDFHISNLFSEHLRTHCTLELREWAIFKVNQDFNGGL